MRRLLLLLPFLLIAGSVTWTLIGPDRPGAAASPGRDGPTRRTAAAAPLEVPPSAEEVIETQKIQVDRTALGNPLLTLLVRSDRDGRVLEGALATLQSEQETEPPRVVKTGTDRAPIAIDPGPWQITFSADGHVDETRAIELALGAQERVEVTLLSAALVSGRAEDRFGKQLGGGQVWFLPPGRSHPRFPRDAEDLISTTIGRDGVLAPLSLAPGEYTVSYGSLGASKLQIESSLSPGQAADLLVVFGGKNHVRFELDRSLEDHGRIEVLLEARNEKDREREAGEGPQKAPKRSKGKDKERWRRMGRAKVEGTTGHIYRAKPGTYRVTLKSNPFSYSSEPVLILGEDESVVVHIEIPDIPSRQQARDRSLDLPKDGPLTIRISPDIDAESRQTGIYWN